MHPADEAPVGRKAPRAYNQQSPPAVPDRSRRLPASPTPPHRIRLLALDVDGTLLDGRSMLRPRTRAAIAAAAEAGIRPVVCTGRRYRRARPIGEMLGIAAPLVCNSGALVKDPSDGRTLWRADFDADCLAAILGLFREWDEPAVGFADRPAADYDFVVGQNATGRPLFDDYVESNRPFARVDPAWSGRDDAHFHLCAIGERPRMLALEAAVLERLGDRVRTFVQKSPNYAGTMCEVLRHDASKWSAVRHVAELWGIAPEEICAVGDDMNDLPMIVGSGLGVAMAHAPEIVRRAADHVAGSNDADGVAEFIERVLLAG